MIRTITETVTAPPRNPSAEIIEAAQKERQEGKRLAGNLLGSMKARFNKGDRAARGFGLMELAKEARRLVKEDREYDLGEDLALIGLDMVKREQQKAEIGPVELDAIQVVLGTAWLAVRNHHGELRVGDPKLKAAHAAADRLQHHLPHWELVIEFINNVGVAFQNAFHFEEVEQRIGPWVESFERMKAPTPTKDYFIGALFGTYSQNLAFKAQLAALKALRSLAPVNHVNDMLEDAGFWSLAACDHFTEPGDLERHKTYRAHYAIQRAILLGDTSALKAAAEELGGDPAKDAECQRFAREFPGKPSTDPAYRVSAWLKLAYWDRRLGAGNSVDGRWVDELTKSVVRSRSILDRHPFEHILGYLMLLSPKPDKLSRKLIAIKWNEGIVKAIAQSFLAQHEFDSTHKVDPDLLKSIAGETNRQPETAQSWKSNGLYSMLDTLEKPGSPLVNGPLMLWPFNYS